MNNNEQQLTIMKNIEKHKKQQLNTFNNCITERTNNIKHGTTQENNGKPCKQHQTHIEHT